MTFYVRRSPVVEVLDDDGKVIARSSFRDGDSPLLVTCAGDDIHEARVTIADNYVKTTLWDATTSAVTDFDYLLFETNGAAILELIEDSAGTPLYSSFLIPANQPFELCADDILNIVHTNGVLSTLDVIDKITCARNVADTVGDIDVRLILVS